jgi:hypothetical protein
MIGFAVCYSFKKWMDAGKVKAMTSRSMLANVRELPHHPVYCKSQLQEMHQGQDDEGADRVVTVADTYSSSQRALETDPKLPLTT